MDHVACWLGSYAGGARKAFHVTRTLCGCFRGGNHDTLGSPGLALSRYSHSSSICTCCGSGASGLSSRLQCIHTWYDCRQRDKDCSHTSFLPTKSVELPPEAMLMPTSFSMICFSVARACER